MKNDQAVACLLRLPSRLDPTSVDRTPENRWTGFRSRRLATDVPNASRRCAGVTIA
jgi:hypothetical protein